MHGCVLSNAHIYGCDFVPLHTQVYASTGAHMGIYFLCFWRPKILLTFLYFTTTWFFGRSNMLLFAITLKLLRPESISVTSFFRCLGRTPLLNLKRFDCRCGSHLHWYSSCPVHLATDEYILNY